MGSRSTFQLPSLNVCLPHTRVRGIGQLIPPVPPGKCSSCVLLKHAGQKEATGGVPVLETWRFTRPGHARAPDWTASCSTPINSELCQLWCGQWTGSCECPTPGSVQSQAGCGLEQPGLVGRFPAHCRGVGTRWSLRFFQPKPFCDFVFLWLSL